MINQASRTPQQAQERIRCDYCGKDIINPYRTWQRFCSANCRRRNHEQKTLIDQAWRDYWATLAVQAERLSLIEHSPKIAPEAVFTFQPSLIQAIQDELETAPQPPGWDQTCGMSWPQFKRNPTYVNAGALDILRRSYPRIYELVIQGRLVTRPAFDRRFLG